MCFEARAAKNFDASGGHDRVEEAIEPKHGTRDSCKKRPEIRLRAKAHRTRLGEDHRGWLLQPILTIIIILRAATSCHLLCGWISGGRVINKLTGTEIIINCYCNNWPLSNGMVNARKWEWELSG